MPRIVLGSVLTSDQYKYYDFGDYSIEALIGSTPFVERPDLSSIIPLAQQLAIWMVENGSPLPISIVIDMDDPEGNIVKVSHVE